MSELRLGGSVRSALWHLCALGLAAICEYDGSSDTRIAWTADLDLGPLVSVPDRTDEDIATAVRRHAERHVTAGSWVAQGLMSPRITPPRDVDTWHALEHSRREVVDELMAREAWLDLRLIGALGEPASWRLDSRGQPRPDDGASRLELQPRNSGATFVANRLRRLAQTVSGRDPAAIIDGLTGRRVEDEAAENRPNSRTATGLAGPGPTDNAVAWCALWGISQLPVAHQVLSPSRTAGHVNASRVGDPRHGWLCLPVPERPVPVPRLRTILASAQLISAVPAQTEDARPAQEALHAERVRAWLLARGVGAVVRFPIEEFGSGNASERRVLAGEVWPLRREPPRR